MSASLPIVVLGAGPAGLAAAEAASANGQPVIVIDENAAPGGQIWRGGPAQWTDRRAHALLAALRSRPHVEFVHGARAVADAGATSPNVRQLLIETEQGGRKIGWDRAILCSGARELLLPFPGWTLPGVTGAGGIQALIKGGVQVGGKHVVIAGSGPLLLAAATTVRRHGGRVLAIAEQRSTRDLAGFLAQLALAHHGKLLQSARLFAGLSGVPYLRGATVVAAKGDTRLRSIVLRHAGRDTEIECDYLACGFGLVPALETPALFGCEVRDGCVVADHEQRTSQPQVWAAGESTGIGGVDKALAEGRIAGLAATGQRASERELGARSKAWSFAALLARSFAPPASLRAICGDSTIVCRCEDVTAAELAPHPDWRSAKLQTRAGMGPCQGRVCGAACEFLYGWQAPGLRQPIFPTAAATLAGIHGDTTKDTP